MTDEVIDRALAYLQSDAAAEHVAALLAQPDPGPHGNRSLRVPECVRATGVVWRASPVGKWQRIELHRALLRYEATYEEVGVFVRQEGERYIVSDLGEAARALRLSSGDLHPDITFDLPEDWGVWMCEDCVIYAGPDPFVGTVAAADLPRAILRVLLAAWQVSTSEVPHGG